MAFLKNRKIPILIFFVFIILPGFSYARGAKLADIYITNSRTDLLVYLKVKNAFTKPIVKAIISGVPTTFSYFITLQQIRKVWMDKTIKEVTLTHTIKYNNLKKAFIITRSWDKGKPVQVKSFAKAKKFMTQINGFKIIPVNQLEKGRKYKISAKAKLSKMSLPFYLHYLMVMASMWEFETDWYTIEFDY